MPEVLVTFAVNQEQRATLGQVLGPVAALRFLADTDPDGRRDALGSADALIVGQFRRDVQVDEIGLLERVRLVQTISAGVDRLPFADLPPGITIAGNAGAFAEPMAEHIMAMILALAKNLIPQNEKLRDGEFDHSLVSRRLGGGTAGIIGFGGIGRATARLLRAFGMKIYAINQSGASSDPADFIGTLADLEHVLRMSDALVLSIPLMTETRNMLGRRELAWMRPEVILINVARGGVIDEGALYEHARDNPGFMAGLDVWWGEPFPEGRFRTQYPLLDLPNVIGSPHSSAHVPDVMVEAVRQAAENVKRFQEGEPIAGVVNREDYVAAQ